jgi:hypothetical protein
MGEHAQQDEASHAFGEVKEYAEMVPGTGESFGNPLRNEKWADVRSGKVHAPAPGMGGNGMQAMGMIAGGADMAGGIADIANGNFIDGILKIGNGGAGMAKSGAELAGYGHHAVQNLGYVGAGFDGLSAINAVRKGDVAGAVKDGTSSVLGFAAPQLVAPWKLGWAVGTGLDAQAKQDNLFGGHRTISNHASDTGRDLQKNLEAVGANQQDAFVAGGVQTIAQAGGDALTTALTTMAISPGVRQIGAEAGGDGPNPLSFSALDLVGLGGVDRARREMVQPQGPNIYDIVAQSIAYNNALKAQIEAQNAGQAPPNAQQPFTGMY